MKKLIALSPIDHDGLSYGEGEPLQVDDDKQAQALIDAGVAIEQKGKAPKVEG